MLPEAQAHSPPAPLQPTPPAPSARLRPGCPSGFAEVATRAPRPPRLRPQPEPLQVPPVGSKQTEWDDILCESDRFIAAGPQWLDLNPIIKRKRQIWSFACWTVKKEHKLLSNLIFCYFQRLKTEREGEREGKAVMMVHPFNTAKVLFSEKSLRRCFLFSFCVRLHQVKESHGNEEKSILISIKCAWLWNGSFCDATRGTGTSRRLLKNTTVQWQAPNPVATPVLSHGKNTFQTSVDKATVFKPLDFSGTL